MNYDDLVKIANELNEEKAEYCREIFSCFEGADYDRGDKIILGGAIALKIDLPGYVDDVIAIDTLGYIDPNGYVVIGVEPKKVDRVRMFTNYGVIIKPNAVFSVTCA